MNFQQLLVSIMLFGATATTLENDVAAPATSTLESTVLSLQPDGWPDRVAGYLEGNLSEKKSIAGRIFDGYIYGSDGRTYSIYDLRGRYSRFEAHLGIPDDWRWEEGTFRFQIDGETVVEGKVVKGDKAIPLELDLTGARSLRIESKNACIADPKFVRSGITDSTKVSLVSPGNGAKHKQGNIMLTWKPIDRAVGYGIHLIATKLDEAQEDGSQRMWAFTSSEQPVFNLNAKELPTGEYRWTVIAFDERRTLGVVSNFRRLLIRE